MTRALSLAAAAGAVVATVAIFAGGTGAATSKAFPQVISLPLGFQPEGLEVGRGNTFYVGSVATGAIYRGNLRTGAGAILVPGDGGRTATGIELDRFNRLFVAGAATGKAFVYDARNGALLRTYTFASPPTFINDVVVTTKAAYFTDSQKAVFYRVPLGPGRTLGNARTIPLSGDFTLASGFNLNGIDATANGKTLVAVQSNTGKLFRIDPNTGVARQISLGAESVPNGDGILLTGRTLYVVQNRNNRVAVIRLSPNLASGQVVARLTDPDFDVPTTLDDHGRRLYAVNARFGTANPGGAAYQVVQFRKAAGR
jgi:outer membrane protein assembly factor BamB